MRWSTGPASLRKAFERRGRSTELLGVNMKTAVDNCVAGEGVGFNFTRDG